MHNWLAYQDKFFLNNPLGIKENDEHALDFSPIVPFSVWVSLDMPFKHPCTALAFFSEGLSNHWQSLCLTLSEICTKFEHVHCAFVRSIQKFHHDSK
jgi:hypothetical protein